MALILSLNDRYIQKAILTELNTTKKVVCNKLFEIIGKCSNIYVHQFQLHIFHFL